MLLLFGTPLRGRGERRFSPIKVSSFKSITIEFFLFFVVNIKKYLIDGWIIKLDILQFIFYWRGSTVVLPPQVMMSYDQLVGSGVNKRIRKGLFSIVWLAYV
jgi:hypothetical protein